MTATARIATTVIGGYLGAGKTTLLNRILADAGEGTVVLVNDCGSVNIDERLVAGSAGGIVALANGCICCSIADGFGAALDRIRALRPAPRRLVVEASGVSDPAKIAVYASLPGFRLAAVIVVADAEQIRRQADDRYVGDVVVDQLAAADLLVINKCDLVAPGVLGELRAWVAERAPRAAIVEAVRADVPLAVALGGADPRRDRPPPAHDHRHDAGDTRFQTWTFAVPGPVDPAGLEEILAELPASVMRVKGIVDLGEPPVRRAVHRVGSRTTWDDVDPQTGGQGQLVAIGAPGAIDAEQWQARFGALGRAGPG